MTTGPQSNQAASIVLVMPQEPLCSGMDHSNSDSSSFLNVLLSPHLIGVPCAKAHILDAWWKEASPGKEAMAAHC